MSQAKVLLVDDEEEFLEILSERLQNRGIQVVTTTSPDRALRMVRDGPFEVLVLDLMMPGIDGFIALDILRKMRPSVHVIFLTGYGTLKDCVEAMKLGAKAFLEKPVDIERLVEEIRHLLDCN